MKRKDNDFSKATKPEEVASSFFSSHLVAFRIKILSNFFVHLLFAGLYAFEHSNQLTLYNQDLTSENTPVANSIQ